MTQRRPAADDSGTSLIFALIIVTVFSVVVAAILTFADSSLRNTILLRGQASDTASADGAAKIAINALRRGTYAGTGNCFGGSDTLTLPSFYQPGDGTVNSAAVQCGLDSPHSGSSPVEISPANKPTNAVLTLGTSAAEPGLKVDVDGGGNLKVHGPVFSNSTVVVGAGSLTTDASLTARGACTGTVTSSPARVCNLGSGPDGRGDDPGYTAPHEDTDVHPLTICTREDQLVTFTPGLYTSITALNNMQRCTNGIFHFPPGVYYFNWTETKPWVIDTGYLVAGTPTQPLVAGTPPTIPGSCVSPVPPKPADPGWSAPGPGTGVTFVFGGGARMILRNSQAEICGSYSATAPPIAVYGLKADVGPVPAQSGCTIAVGGCATIQAESSSTSRLYVQGTTYLPKAALDVAVSNPVGLIFSVGVIARTLTLHPTSTAGLADPVIEIPDNAPAGRRTVVYLTVYLCPASSTCTTATGTSRLRAKIGILDPTGSAVAGVRQISVLSWSVLR